MKFKLGQSGNPSGRPKSDFAIAELAKAKTEAAIACLVGVMENPEAPAAARVSAAQAILDRGWGRSTQAVTAQVTGQNDGPLIVRWANSPEEAEGK